MIVVTGRMFRSVRPYVLQAGIDDPVICYQGAVVADPVTGEFLRHIPVPHAVALEAIDAVVAAGFHVNCYVDDLLYVAELTPEARSYADFQGLEINVVGDLQAWLKADPTKIVAVGDPAALDELEAELKPRFKGRLYISKSLPYFLEFAHPDVSKGAGLQFVADRIGFDAGADGRVRRRRERPRAARLGRLRRRRRERASGHPAARRSRRSAGRGGRRRRAPRGVPRLSSVIDAK